MEESLCNFAFYNLRYDKYLALEIMMYIEIPDGYKFMFNLNKDSRLFLQQNFITLRNGFINEGLITF